jgi:hypothetical protein
MRQVRMAAGAGVPGRPGQPGRLSAAAAGAVASEHATVSQSPGRGGAAPRKVAGREMWLDAWRWALDNRAEDGSLPSGEKIARQFGRHERWGRLVKRSGLAGELSA